MIFFTLQPNSPRFISLNTLPCGKLISWEAFFSGQIKSSFYHPYKVIQKENPQLGANARWISKLDFHLPNTTRSAQVLYHRACKRFDVRQIGYNCYCHCCFRRVLRHRYQIKDSTVTRMRHIFVCMVGWQQQGSECTIRELNQTIFQFYCFTSAPF